MDPVRWRDDPSAAPPGASELLQAGGPAQPLAPAARERLAQEVARVAALPKASLWASAQAKWAAGAGGVLLAGAAVFGVTRSQPVLEAAPIARAAPASAEVVAPAAEPMPSVALTPDPTPSTRTPAPKASEAAYLETARALLAAQPVRALALANAHQRAFPQGKLGTEADVIAAQALARLGNSKAAAARARASLARAPNSIYAEQLRTLAGDR